MYFILYWIMCAFSGLICMYNSYSIVKIYEVCKKDGGGLPIYGVKPTLRLFATCVIATMRSSNNTYLELSSVAMLASYWLIPTLPHSPMMGWKHYQFQHFAA